MAIALALTAVVFVIGFFRNLSQGESWQESLALLTKGWYGGLWDNSSGGLHFAFQMMLILVLGHVLAKTEPFQKFIGYLSIFGKNNSTAVVLVAITSILLGFVNWGLALVLSALLVKHLLQKLSQQGQKVNAGLLGAAAYTCMLVWHGGLSGSSPIKSSEPGALQEILMQAGYSEQSGVLGSISVTETIFSNLNLTVSLMLIVLLPLVLFYMSKRIDSRNQLHEIILENTTEQRTFRWNLSALSGLVFLVVALFLALQNNSIPLGFLNVNYINLCLLGLGLLLHNNLEKFSAAVHYAIQDASGILIQFPIYFGIIGLMKTSGLTILLSEYFVEISNAGSFHVLSFLSAGILNFFIPSGGGQFYIQGPILIQSALELGVSVPKTIMALSYGDQWTNMLQPFWALPLIGITKIRLSALLPYCLALFAVSGAVFIAALLIF